MAANGFTLDEFDAQLQKLKAMGPLSELMKRIPGMSRIMGEQAFDDRELDHMQAIIRAMTPKERANPELIDASCRQRIARGAGVDTRTVSGFVRQFVRMRDVMNGSGR